MNHFVINGVETTSPLAQNESFAQLMRYVQSNLVNERQLLASLKVNGEELGEADEQALSAVPLSAIESVEITFVHPREMVEDTLQTLKLFTGQLADLSFRAADQIGVDPLERDFQKLIEGLSTMMDTLSGVRSLLRLTGPDSVRVLEADLLSILKDLLSSHEEGDTEYRIQLLREHLPKNLDEWTREGIPAIISSRDS